VSLIPIGGVATGVTTGGLKWELSGDDLEPGSTRGLSNVMRAPVADIKLESGCLLVVFSS
jgi:thiamine pyrophosphokinase